jgi:hypothetical protein
MVAARPCSVSECRGVETHPHDGVAGSLSANDPQLTELKDVPRSVGMRELAAALALNTTLTSLSLWGRGLVAADAHELAGALGRNKTLEALSLSRNNIGPEGARYLAAALERNNSLTTLNLGRSNIGPDGARHLAAALERNKTLKTLNLTSNNIGPDGACYLAAALERNSVLETLWLGENNVGDDGAAAFRTALERNNTLVELALSYNNIGEDGARHLAAALERNFTLTRLYLSGNDIGQAGATAALRTALEANCTLERLVGVNGVDDILERNRGVRVARKQQVMLRPSFIAQLTSCCCIVLSCCGGSARAEAIQPRALFAGIVSVERLQQLSDCWLQSNVKDVVRLIARLLWGTKVGELGVGGVPRFSLTWFVGTDPFGVGQGRRANSKATAWTG